MTDNVQVEQTVLPGVGVRQELATAAGRRLGVIELRDGRRVLLVYDRDDPDACSETLRLTDEEADALAGILGAPKVVRHLARLSEQAGLVIEQLPVEEGSPYAGATLGDTQARTRTGASIVAVLRDGAVHPSPGPDFPFAAGDLVVVVGTREGVDGVAAILTGRG
jgi:TrkA domain protein